jgi:hypothetical protein
MAGVSVLAYKQFWTDKWLPLKTRYKDIGNYYPDAPPTMQQLFKVMCDTESQANSTPISAGENKERTAIISSAEDKCEDYCKVLRRENTIQRTVWHIYSDAT